MGKQKIIETGAKGRNLSSDENYTLKLTSYGSQEHYQLLRDVNHLSTSQICSFKPTTPGK